MATWFEISSARNASNGYNLVRRPKGGGNREVVRKDIGKPFVIGPALGSEIRAAGIGNGIVWGGDVLRVDVDMVTGPDLTTLVNVILAHDETTARPPNPKDLLETYARGLRQADPENMTKEQGQELLRLVRDAMKSVNED